MKEGDTKMKDALEKDLEQNLPPKVNKNNDVNLETETTDLATKEEMPTAESDLQDVAEVSMEIGTRFVSESKNKTSAPSSELSNKTFTSDQEKLFFKSKPDATVIQQITHVENKLNLETEPLSSNKFELPTIICTRDKSPRESEDNLVDSSTTDLNTRTTPNQPEKLNSSEESEHYLESHLDSLPPSPTALSPASSRLPSPTLSDRYLSPDFTTPHGSPKVSDKDQDDDTGSVATQDEETLDPIREKRYAALKILREIELDFAKLRQRLYREKVVELDKEIDHIINDTHPSLTLLLQPVELKRRQRVSVADYLRKMQILTISNMCTAMEYQIGCEYQEKERELKHTIAEGIGSKRIKLSQEWNMPEDAFQLDHELPPLKRKSRLRGTNLSTRSIAKSMALTGLEQSEIDQDMAILSGLGSF